MPEIVSARLDASGLRFALVVGRFNELVGERLLAGALDALKRHGAEDAGLSVARVPGSFEVPQMAERLAATKRFDAIVGLGVLLRGETAHFDLIAAQAVKGLGDTALRHGLPVALGILTCDSLEQALERAGGKHGNKGAEAALAALEMACLYRSLAAEDERQSVGFGPRRGQG